MVPMLRWTERENQGGAKKNIKKQKGCGPEVENVLKKNVLLVLQANRADFDESETRLHEPVSYTHLTLPTSDLV